MIKHHLFTSIYTLFFALLIFSSCNGQVKTNQPQEKGETEAYSPFKNVVKEQTDTATQISEYVVSVFEDSKGNLWFGTMSDGAARFDGKTLTYFSTKEGLCDNTVASIAQDKEGNMWFGTHAGASKYDGKTFTNFTESKGISGAGCKILIDRKGNIWAGTNNGLSKFNGTSFSPFELPNPKIENPSAKWIVGKIWDIMEDSKGNIWFGRDGYGACKYDGTSFTHFTKNEGLVSNNVSRIIEDKQGNIWFAGLSSDKPKETNDGGLSCYNGKTVTKYPEIEGRKNNDIYSIYKDKNGNIWIGATGLGIYCYDGQSFKLYKGTDRMDLTWSMGIQSMLEDSKGRLWFGFSGGLFRFKENEVKNVTKEMLLKGE